MTIHKYDKDLTIFIGGGGNSLILKNEKNDKILIADTKMMGSAKKMKKHIDNIGGSPEIVIINTHNHIDHIGGNDLYPESTLITGDLSDGPGSEVKDKIKKPDIKLKPGDEYKLTIGREVVIVKNMGQAHTFNDLIVYLTNRKILITGDIVFLGRHPVIMESGGSDADKWIGVLNTLLRDYPAATIVPGHGDISDKSALITIKEYFEDIKGAAGDEKRISDLRKKYKKLRSMPFISGFMKTLTHFQKKAIHGK